MVPSPRLVPKILIAVAVSAEHQWFDQDMLGWTPLAHACRNDALEVHNGEVGSEIVPIQWMG